MLGLRLIVALILGALGTFLALIFGLKPLWLFPVVIGVCFFLLSFFTED